MLVIGVAGGTGSGKTTVVKHILDNLPEQDVSLLSQDSYYKQTEQLSYEQRRTINFDHPNAVDFDLLKTHIAQLRSGLAVEEPMYSFKDHTRTAQTNTVFPRKVLILEGILIFTDAGLRDLCDIKIFIHVDSDERLIRRLRRDMAERGRNLDEVLQRYQQTLKPMHDKYIEPTMKYADIIIPTHKSSDTAIELVRSVIRHNLNT